MDVLRLLFLVSFLFSTTGCLFTYLVNSSYNHIKMLNSGVPIKEVLEREDLDPELKRKLLLTIEVREFLTQKLGLKNTKNYQDFVDLKRPYITYIVTVAYKNKLEPKLFWFPFVGNLPYKGFFQKKDADREAAKFDTNKYDVMVRGVTAYSTLGWFSDPLLSSMLRGDDYHLVNTLIHESTHATLFIKSEADFNERLATFIGNMGTKIFYLQKEGENSKTLDKIRIDLEDENLFSDFITKEVKALKSWYKTNSGSWFDKREQKFKEIQQKFKDEITPKLKTQNYSRFAEAKLNNAILLYYNTYVTDLSLFSNLYDHFDQDFSRMITFCKSLEKNPNPLRAVKNLISPPAVSEQDSL